MRDPPLTFCGLELVGSRLDWSVVGLSFGRVMRTLWDLTSATIRLPLAWRSKTESFSRPASALGRPGSRDAVTCRAVG